MAATKLVARATVCDHHKLVAAQGWVTSDKLVPSC